MVGFSKSRYHFCTAQERNVLGSFSFILNLVSIIDSEKDETGSQKHPPKQVVKANHVPLSDRKPHLEKHVYSFPFYVLR